jgi:transcriptional regulator with XRE-family HTH domain
MKLSKEQVCKEVGARIREERLKRGLTLEKLAHDAELDYSQLNRIELGKINTSIYQIYQISVHLQISLPEIFHSVKAQ